MTRYQIRAPDLREGCARANLQAALAQPDAVEFANAKQVDDGLVRAPVGVIDDQKIGGARDLDRAAGKSGVGLGQGPGRKGQGHFGAVTRPAAGAGATPSAARCPVRTSTARKIRSYPVHRHSVPETQ